MEEKIYQKIKAGLKNNSVSERSIRNKAVRMSEVYTDETLTDAIVADAVADLEDYAGQLNKEIADAVKMQKEKLEAEYKAKYLNPTPTPTPTPTPDNPFGQVAEEWKKKIEEVDNLKKLVEERLQSEKVTKLKDEAAKILREKHNADKDYVLRNAISKVKVEDADTPDTLAAKIVPLYDTEYKEAYGEGVAPRQSGGGADTQKTEALKNLVEKRKGEMKKP